MAGYTKLFSSIIGSTVWRERNHVRIVWVTLLALADRRGIVEASVPGLADFARVTRRQCDEALERLKAPDPDSRSPADDGRRIRTVLGGWQLVNFGAYRQKMGADERREYKRLKELERRQQGKVGARGHEHGHRGQNVDIVDTVPEAEAVPEAKADVPRARARGPRYAYDGRVLKLTHPQHEVLVRMCNAVDVDLLGEVYPRWNRDLEASGEPFDAIPWCTTQLTRELGIRRPGGPTTGDRREAEGARRRVGRCPHTPPCADHQVCVEKFAVRYMLRRTKPLAVRA